MACLTPLDPLVDAASILNKEAPGRFCFRLVGDGPSKTNALRQKALAEDISNLRFEDPVPRQQILSKLREADAFIICMKKTGLYRYGISPNKLHEYMAAARPTIVAGYVNNKSYLRSVRQALPSRPRILGRSPGR